jgi:hypothetical protein
VVAALIDRFGDGVSGVWRVPGEFGKAVEVTKVNTTLFAGDRDMFCFLTDEQNRIEIPGRRGGRGGSLARGFFVWNSEVGDRSIGLGFFLFDYTCSNRIVWGVHEYNEIRISHTKSAPDKYVEKMMPVIDAYANSAASSTMQAIEQARQKRLGDKLDEFLSKRFTKTMATSLKAIHEAEENRPIENIYDVTTAVTAYARSIQHQDRRVELERRPASCSSWLPEPSRVYGATPVASSSTISRSIEPCPTRACQPPRRSWRCRSSSARTH